MEKRVKVIATFSTEGQILPLWLQIPSDDECDPIKILAATRVPVEPAFALYMTFICQIEVGDDCSREVRLRFNKKEMYWEIICNKSMNL